MSVIGLVQIGMLDKYAFLPLSVGLIQSYYKRYGKHNKRYTFLDPLVERISPNDAVRRFQGCDAILFSVYAWNEQISLAIAKAVKRSSPETVIVFGGPQVPLDSGPYLRKNRFIDILSLGEGELAAQTILDALLERDWQATLSTCYLENDRVVVRPRPVKQMSLEYHPSPYLDGTFDSLIRNRSDICWMAPWETNRGCPNKCAYCGWDQIGRRRTIPFPMQRVLGELSWFHTHDIKYVFLCDAGFGILKRDKEIIDQMILCKEKYNTEIKYIICYTNFEKRFKQSLSSFKKIVKNNLSAYIGIDLQSVSLKTISEVKRLNFSQETYSSITKECSTSNIPTSTNLILSLPYETYESFIAGIDTCIDSGQYNRIVVFTLIMLPNAPLSHKDMLEKHSMDCIRVPLGGYPGSRFAPPVVEEQIWLAVGSSSMPRENWIQARTYAWMTGLIFFGRLAQIPILLARHLFDIPYKTIFQAIMDADREFHPHVAAVADFLVQEATRITNGGHDYIHAPDWFDLWWFHDQYLHIKMTLDNTLDVFLCEIGKIIRQTVSNFGDKNDAATLLHDATRLNTALVRRPATEESLQLDLQYDILSIYNDIICGTEKKIAFRKDRQVLTIDRAKEYLSKDDFIRLINDNYGDTIKYLHSDEAIVSHL